MVWGLDTVGKWWQKAHGGDGSQKGLRAFADPGGHFAGARSNQPGVDASGAMAGAAGQAGDFAQMNQGRYDATGTRAMDTERMMAERAQGKNLMSAEMLRQGLQQNVAGMRSMAAGARGGNQAAAMRQAMMSGGQAGAGLAGQQAMAGIAEQNANMNSLGALQMQRREQELKAALGSRQNQLQGLGNIEDNRSRRYAADMGVPSDAERGMGLVSGAVQAYAMSDRTAKTDIKDGSAKAESAAVALAEALDERDRALNQKKLDIHGRIADSYRGPKQSGGDGYTAPPSAVVGSRPIADPAEWPSQDRVEQLRKEPLPFYARPSDRLQLARALSEVSDVGASRLNEDAQSWLDDERKWAKEEFMRKQLRNAADKNPGVPYEVGPSGKPEPVPTHVRHKDIIARRDTQRSIDNLANQIADTSPPYDYKYKEPGKYGKGRNLGVMAQDLEKTPIGHEVVKNTPNGKMIDTNKLTTANTALIASLAKRLKELEGDQ